MAGIVDTIKLAGVLVFAIPAALAGLELLLARGEPVAGGALLVLAGGLVVIQRRLTMPSDIPGLVAGRLFGGLTAGLDDGSDADDLED